MRRTLVTRRTFLAELGAGVALAAAPPALADKAEVEAVLRSEFAERALRPGRVTIELPPIVENAALVPMTVRVESAMAGADRVRRVLLLGDNNPRPRFLSAQFGPRAGHAELETNIRLNASQNVIAVAEMADGNCWTARMPVLVTVGSCDLLQGQALETDPARTTRLAVPARAKKGEIVPLRAMILHPMESGLRLDAAGRAIPRNIVTDFACRYDGEEVVRIALDSALASNPVFGFSAIASGSGAIEFAWAEDDGRSYSASAALVIA